MTKGRLKFIYIMVLLLQLYSLSTIFIALVGSNENLTVENHDEENLSFGRNSDSMDIQEVQSVNKIVIVVIDAMRFDFIPQMDFIRKSLDENYTCLFQVNLNGPTVTLPRIKALVSGATSSYWDILTNLKQSSQMAIDNVIWRANAVGKSVIFYGDDTWLKLFPGSEFKRKEGVTSFFVTDFYEVDSNVTRNVDIEIENKFDFDMMILHYLGVDHVGHVHGPKHSLIPVKLKEMDGIIENIYSQLKLIDSQLPHTILITGDHGMANQGGHGGDSLPEVTTPLVILTVHKDSVKPVCQPKEKTANWMENPYKMKQVDTATMISLLWGLPLPNNSHGTIPNEIISQFSLTKALSVLHIMAKHLSKFLPQQKQSDIILEKLAMLNLRYEQLLDTTSQQRQHELVKEYQNLMPEIRSLAVQDNTQDIFTIISSMILLFQTMLMLMIPIGILHINFLVIGFILSPIISLSPSPIFLLPVINLFFIIRWILTPKFWNIWKSLRATTTSSILINVPNFIIPILYFSSSFVEEEHLPTYYLYATTVIVCVCVLLYPISFSRFEVTMKFVTLLAIHRFCSSLNGTGQKWNYLTDASDILNDYNLTTPVMIASFSSLIIFKFSTTLDRICAILICCYKLNISNLLLGFGTQNSNHFEAKFCYLLILTSLVCSKWTRKDTIGLKYKNSSTNIRWDNTWILLCCLLQRNDNIVLIPLLHWQVNIIRGIDSEIFKLKKTSILAPLIHLLVYSAFFYQGNSNNITTIDISLGYTGLSTYNEYLVGTLTFIGTFSLPILVIILSCFKNGESNFIKAREDNVLALLVFKILSTNFIYSIVLFLMRQHLFIWSVFVPKLLYLIAFTFLVLVIALVDYLVGVLNSNT